MTLADPRLRTGGGAPQAALAGMACASPAARRLAALVGPAAAAGGNVLALPRQADAGELTFLVEGLDAAELLPLTRAAVGVPVPAAAGLFVALLCCARLVDASAFPWAAALAEVLPGRPPAGGAA